MVRVYILIAVQYEELYGLVVVHLAVSCIALMWCTLSSTWSIENQTPFSSEELRINSHSILSYVLLISVLIAINLYWHDLFVSIPLNISCAIKILSEIKRPTKDGWVSYTSFDRQLFRLWYKTLEIILYPTLQRLISPSYVILIGLSIFGIKQIFVVFNLVSSFLVWKKVFTKLSMSSLIIYQACWKKKVVIPSSPGTFSEYIINNSSRTSSLYLPLLDAYSFDDLC